MKTVSSALLLTAVAIALLGCSDNTGLPVGPSERAQLSGSLAKAAGLHSATGSAPYRYFFGMPANSRFVFTAHQIAVGSSAAKGEVQGSGELGYEVKFHGKVFDLKVDHDNTWAKLFWKYTDGPWVGQYGFGVVIDNGEGNNAAAPDMVSWLAFAVGNEPELGGTTIQQLVDMSPTEYLAWTESQMGVPPEMFLLQTDYANVQVR